MADTSAALQTQQFMSESQRQSALDLSGQIAMGFKAAGEGVRFESEVAQSMVRAASDFKQTQIDEWYKKEQVAFEAKRINLAEKQAIALNEHRKDQLEAQNNRADVILKSQEERKKYTEEGKEYQALTGDIEASAESHKLKIDVANNLISANSSERSLLEDEYKRVANSSITQFPSSSAKRDELERIRGRMSILDNDIITAKREAVVPMEMYSKFKSLSERARARSAPIETLRGQLDSFKEPSLIPENKTKDSSSFAEDPLMLRDSYAPSGVNNVIKDEPKKYTRSIDDVYEYQQEKDYNPKIARELFNEIPEEEKNRFVKNVTTLRVNDLADMAFTSTTPSESKIRKHSQFSEILGDDFNESIASKTKITQLNALKVARERLNIIDPNETPPEWKMEISDYRKGAMMAMEVASPDATGTPKPVSLPGKGKGVDLLNKVTSSNATTTSNNEIPTDNLAYEKRILGIDNPDSIARLKATGEYQERASAFSSMESYKKELVSAKSKNKSELMSELANFSLEDLGLANSREYGHYLSKKGLPLRRTNEKLGFIEFLLDTGKAAPLLAELTVRSINPENKKGIESFRKIQSSM